MKEFMNILLKQSQKILKNQILINLKRKLNVSGKKVIDVNTFL